MVAIEKPIIIETVHGVKQQVPAQSGRRQLWSDRDRSQPVAKTKIEDETSDPGR